jgi:hypothetical protein
MWSIDLPDVDLFGADLSEAFLDRGNLDGRT